MSDEIRGSRRWRKKQIKYKRMEAAKAASDKPQSVSGAKPIPVPASEPKKPAKATKKSAKAAKKPAKKKSS